MCDRLISSRINGSRRSPRNSPRAEGPRTAMGELRGGLKVAQLARSSSLRRSCYRPPSERLRSPENVGSDGRSRDIAADVCRCPVADRPVAGTAPRACAMHRFLSPRWSAGRETERNLHGTHQAVDVLLRRQFQFQLDQDRTQTDSIKEQAAVTASPDHRRRYSARG